jgi:hypothetical protein
MPFKSVAQQRFLEAQPEKVADKHKPGKIGKKARMALAFMSAKH